MNNEVLLTRPSWIEIDLKAVQFNAKSILKHTDAQRLIAVVKANAYGHGAIKVAQALYDIGVRDFAVATIAEGIELRSALYYENVKIILLGVQDVNQIHEIIKYRLSPAVESVDWLDQALHGMNDSEILNVEIAVDTGMGRMGAHSKQALQDVYDKVQESSLLQLTGVFTHFATADDNNQSYYMKQLKLFEEWVESANIPKKYWHLANSGSSLWHYREINTQTIRVGSVLYGFNPGAPLLKMPIKLHSVLTLKSKIGAVHKLQTGESVSYGATYTAQEPQWVATLPIGYADGYLRRMAGMKVLIDGQIATVVGRITMDQLVIAMDRYHPIDTEVTLIGKSGSKEISIEEFSSYAGTIPHEIVTSLSSRLPRVYIK